MTVRRPGRILARGVHVMATSERKLGRRTLAALVDALERARTDTNIRKLLFKHGLEDRYAGKNIGDRLGNVFYPLVSQQRYAELSPRTFVTPKDYRRAIERAWSVIDEIAIDAYETVEEYGLESSEQLLWTLRQGLRVDGYDLLNGRVVPFLSPSVEPAVEQGVLESRTSRRAGLLSHPQPPRPSRGQCGERQLGICKRAAPCVP